MKFGCISARLFYARLAQARLPVQCACPADHALAAWPCCPPTACAVQLHVRAHVLRPAGPGWRAMLIITKALICRLRGSASSTQSRPPRWWGSCCGGSCSTQARRTPPTTAAWKATPSASRCAALPAAAAAGCSTHSRVRSALSAACACQAVAGWRGSCICMAGPCAGRRAACAAPGQGAAAAWQPAWLPPCCGCGTECAGSAQIDWDESHALYKAWDEGRTGCAPWLAGAARPRAGCHGAGTHTPRQLCRLQGAHRRLGFRINPKP